MSDTALKIFLLVVVALLFGRALLREYTDQPNAYLSAFPEKHDTERVLFKKLGVCLEVDTKVVRWRRALIAAVIFLITTCILFKNIPSYKEIFLTLLMFYVIFYGMWVHYSETITVPVRKLGGKLIRKIRTIRACREKFLRDV